MKRTLLSITPNEFPSAFWELLSRSTVYDSSCSPEARVIYIEKENGYYLKSAAEGTLRREAEMTRYFHGKGLSGEVLYYGSEGGRDYLLTSRVRGEDCCDKQYLDDPRRLSALLGERLRALHETEMADCPERDRMRGYLATVTENYEKGQYDLSFFPGHATVDEIWHIVEDNESYLKNNTLLHGDFCLPNVMLDNWRFTGFLDLDNAGIGDRHVDLFWGMWTLNFNLKTDSSPRPALGLKTDNRLPCEGLKVFKTTLLWSV